MKTRYGKAFLVLLALLAFSWPLLAQVVEQERTEFKTLLLANPNYFGNFPKGPFKPVKVMKGNTKYEEVTCLGFNPDLNLLQAVVKIKLPFGYKGNLCSGGSTEYVRLFIDYGAGWENVGLVAFNVHDIPNATDCAGKLTKPISYTVTQEINPKRNFCGMPVLPKVRAVLSWEDVPPEDDANWPMVWGNSQDGYIQIKTRPWLILDVFKFIELQIKQPIQIPEYFEEAQNIPIPLPDPPPLNTIDRLVKLYPLKATIGEATKAAETRIPTMRVEPHRFGYPEIAPFLGPSALSSQLIVKKAAIWKTFDLDLMKALQDLLAMNGNVGYEELVCLGLDYNREWLTATVHVKKPYGYLGNLCQKGSQEYVAFWADWDSACEWRYLDTVSVSVHDIAQIPAEGLYYTVTLPVNLDPVRQPCTKPKIGRIRAVLSWYTPPSQTDPNNIPYWGNLREAHVQIKPGVPVSEPVPRISILGGVGIADINASGNGMTKPTAKFAISGNLTDAHLRECPFGGTVYVQAPPVANHKYCVWVHKVGSSEPVARLTNPIYVVNQYGVGSFHYPDAAGFFTYLDLTQNILNLLAAWQTIGDDLWEISLELRDMSQNYIGITPWYKIQLDNTAPSAEITIDGGACDQYTPGMIVKGRFVARDLHFGHFTLFTLPESLALPPPITATPFASPTTPPPGDVWELNTTGWQPCGYVVRIKAWDRTIVNSGYSDSNRKTDDKGFCLLRSK